MIITKEISSFDEFEAWSGGGEILEDLSENQKELLFQTIEETYPEGLSETHLNNILRFEDEWIREVCGIDEDGDEIGTDDWAIKVLKDHFSQEEQDMYNSALETSDAIADMIEKHYYCNSESDKDVDNVASSFQMWAYEEWLERMQDAMVEEFPEDMNPGTVEDILDCNNYDYDNITTIDVVRKLVEEYIEENKEDEGA